MAGPRCRSDRHWRANRVVLSAFSALNASSWGTGGFGTGAATRSSLRDFGVTGSKQAAARSTGAVGMRQMGGSTFSRGQKALSASPHFCSTSTVAFSSARSSSTHRDSCTWSRLTPRQATCASSVSRFYFWMRSRAPHGHWEGIDSPTPLQPGELCIRDWCKKSPFPG